MAEDSDSRAFYIVEKYDEVGETAHGPYTMAEAEMRKGETEKIVTQVYLASLKETLSPEENPDSEHFLEGALEENNLINDIFLFHQIPLRSSVDNSEYLAMGWRGTLKKVTGLLLFNTIITITIYLFSVWSNPYVFPDDWGEPLSPALLFFTGYLVITSAQFLCFRAISRKGDLVAYAYLSALFSANYSLLSLLAIFILVATRIRGIESIVTLIGGVYLLYVSFIAFQTLFKISVGRTIAGFVLASIVSLPLFICLLVLFGILNMVGRNELYDWRFVLLMIALLLVDALLLSYMNQQQKLVRHYPEGVPLLQPIKIMMNWHKK